MRNVRRTLWVVLFLAIPCVAGTIIVNPDGTGDYPTIRSALDATNDGDEVLVNNGTYVENIVWPQRNNIKMTSVNGPDVTIIDGSGLNMSVVDIRDNTKGVEIRGFTITGGIGSRYIQHNGGGILVRDNCSALIKNCKITGNNIDHHPENSRGYGTYGSIFIGVGSRVVIEGCEVYGNEAGEYGGVYYRNFTSEGMIRNCIIYNNKSIGLYCQRSPIAVYNNTIVNNNGTGIKLSGLPWPTVKNNIISSNSGYAMTSNNPADSTNLITYNNVWANSSGDCIYIGSGYQEAIVGQYGNISMNPLFVGGNPFDYHLTQSSYCIDAGDPTYVAEPNEADLDGNPRIINGRIDMGAYEVQSAPPVADANGPYTLYAGDTLTLDASGSTDDENDITSYVWDLDDDGVFETDAGTQAVFDVSYAYLESLGLLIDVDYNIHLKVTDGDEQADTDTTTLTIEPQLALVIAVDIKPTSCPNPLNVKSKGVLPVAILGSDIFDVTTIDATSIRLKGVGPIRHSFEDVAAPGPDVADCNCVEDGPDGFVDLTLKFKTQQIVEVLGEVDHGDVITLELTGVLFDETPIEGADCIVIRGRRKPFNKGDINQDGVVNMLDFIMVSQDWLKSSIVDD